MDILDLKIEDEVIVDSEKGKVVYIHLDINKVDIYFPDPYMPMMGKRHSVEPELIEKIDK